MAKTTLRVKTTDKTARVKRVAKERSIKSLGQAGAYVRTLVRNSLRRSTKSSPPGQPPKTQTGAIKQSIMFSVDNTQEIVTIGPAASRLGKRTGGAHEFGQVFRGRKYPARPFLRPALEKSASKLPAKWQGIVREN